MDQAEVIVETEGVVVALKLSQQVKVRIEGANKMDKYDYCITYVSSTDQTNYKVSLLQSTTYCYAVTPKPIYVKSQIYDLDK